MEEHSMPSNRTPNRRSFKLLERNLTIVVMVDLVLFVLMLAASGCGVLWLKILAGIVTMLLSAAGCLFLVLIEEHRRARSWWILAAFGAILVCALVSLITGSPAPGVAS